MTPLTFDVGTWFLLPEIAIRGTSGRLRSKPFSSKQGFRPVILTKDSQNHLATVLPRSTSTKSWSEPRTPHPKHCHRQDYPYCSLNRDGYVVKYLAPVSKVTLAHYGATCEEPSNTGLLNTIHQWISI